MPDKGLTIFQMLRRDHRNTRQLLDALQSEIDRISAGGRVDYHLLFMIMDYLINYPDLYHHAEETALFVYIKKHNELLGQAIDRILNEHKDAGMLSRRIAAALHNMQHGTEVPVQHLQNMVHDYVARQKDHMVREDTVYFPLLEHSLAPMEWHEVSEQLAKIEDPLFGENVRQTYLDRHANIMQLMVSSG